jgi:hypothetical protein
VDRFVSFFVALCLAVLVWLYARSRDPETLDNVPIPVQVSLATGQAENFDLEVTGPSQVPVSFQGPPSRIRELRNLLQIGGLCVQMTLPVGEDRQKESRYFDTVRVDASDIHPPPGVTPLVIEGRNRIAVTVRRMIQRQLPVRLDTAPEDRVSQINVEPATVLVKGPKVVLDRLRAMPTQPFLIPSGTDLPPDKEGMAEISVPLARELEGRPISPVPDSVKVRLTYRPLEKLYDLTGVPIQFLCPGDFDLQPRFLGREGGTINLHLRGPAGERPKGVVAYLDLTARKLDPGLYANEPLRLQLPKDFHLAQESPRSPPFQLVLSPGTRSPAGKALAP